MTAYRRACAHCGDGFRPHNGDRRTRYCSRICAGLAKRVLPWAICPQCDTRYPLRRSTQILCSRECASHWRFNLKRLERVA